MKNRVVGFARSLAKRESWMVSPTGSPGAVSVPAPTP